MMDAARRLIVNADDFGLSEGVNRGIIESHERGILTSSSLMVDRPAAAAAAAYARANPTLGVGLHVDLSEWVYRDGAWVALYQRVPVNDRTAVEAELARQFGVFRGLLGRDPTHIDSHQHVHRDEPVRSVAEALARGLDVPLRHFTPGIRYVGSFYGQTATGEPYPDAIRVETLIALLRGLPPGTTELGCHPGWADDAETTYRGERANEVRTLCDPRARAALSAAGLVLCTFRELRTE